MQELKLQLLARDYPEKLVDSALARAKAIPRKIALKTVQKKTTKNRPVFAIKFDPRLPAISSIQAKHWRSMTSQDEYLSSVFTQPPLTAYRRQMNLRNYLIKSKLPPMKIHDSREIKGMTKCNKTHCTACPYIKSGRKVKINEKLTWNINKKVNCESFNVIYLLECEKSRCRMRYIGTTSRLFKFRLAEHRGYITNKVTSKATGFHFNLPGHSLANMKATVIEQVNTKDEEYRKEREKYFIRKFNTFYQGMNREM